MHSLRPRTRKPHLVYEQNFFNVPLPKGSSRKRVSWPKPTIANRSRLMTHSQGTNYCRLALQHIHADHLFAQYHANHIFDVNGKKQNIDTLLRTDPTVWQPSMLNELGRLSQGIGDVKGTDTIDFIPRSAVPANRKVTYANMVCDYRPLKSEPYHVRLTVGRDKLDYANNAGSPAASLLETKLIVNSVISDASKGARFCTADLKDHFLATPMEEDEYMKIHSKYFFDDIRKQYNIDSLVHTDGYVYVKIK